MNPRVNDRTDRHAGDTISGRIAFTPEVVDAIAGRIGASRVGIRISPHGRCLAPTGPVRMLDVGKRTGRLV